MDRIVKRVILLWALLAVAYHFTTVWSIPFGATRHYTVHLGLMMVLAVLSVASRVPQGRGRGLRLAFLATLLASGLVSAAYIFVDATRLELIQPWLTSLDVVIAVLLIYAVLGMTYMIWGMPDTVMALACIAYFFYGYLLPDLLWHLEFPPLVVTSYLAGLGTVRGVFWGIPLSAETIFMLLTYGGLLQGTRVLEMFIEVGKAVGNLVRGGIAYSSVVSSSLIAMVTGEAISNVVLAGSININAMRSRGFTRNQAGAIEVVASCGSQITPPIMSVAAFMMAAILNIAYFEIVQRAILPALLYFCGISFGVWMMIRTSPAIPYQRESVDVKLVLGILPSFAVSFVVLVYLLYLRHSPGFAAFWGCSALLALSLLRPKLTRPSFGSILDGLRKGAVGAAHLFVILAAIGIMIQTFLVTGLGIVLGRLMTDWSGGHLWVALIIGAGIAILLGGPLPTPATYALTAVTVVPALINLGASPFAAHFFALYWAAFSTISPPVALAVTAAVSISGGTFYRTAWESIKLSIPVFFLPFAYVLTPSIIGIPGWSTKTLEVALAIVVASIAAGAGFSGFLVSRLSVTERCLLLAAPFVLYAYLFTGWSVILLLVVAALIVTIVRGFRAAKAYPRRKMLNTGE